jgi:hypothetical protein
MKNFKFLFYFSVFTLIVSCSKEEYLMSSTLVGKWQYIGGYQSIGGPAEFVPAKLTDRRYLEFGPTGSLTGDDFAATSYKLKDSVTLIIINNDKRELDYYYKVKDGQLTLSPRTIEGCSAIYNKVSE